MKRLHIIAVLGICVSVSACVSLGGDDEADFDAELAMPTDTYDNCSRSVSGFLTGGGGGGGAIQLGMSECALIRSLGDADEVLPQFAPQGERRVILSYAHPQGGSTAYLFVNNALKEINRVP